MHTVVSRKVVQLKSIKAYATIPKGMMGCSCSLCIAKFTSFQRDARRCYEYLFACVKRNKMDPELLTCLLKFIEYFPDYLSALSRTLLRFFGQPLSKQLYIKRVIIKDKEGAFDRCTMSRLVV